MLKKARGFELTELLAMVVIIVILATLIAPNIIIGIQNSKQEITLKDITVISTDIIGRTNIGYIIDKYIQDIMGVIRAEKELAKSIEILNEHLTKTWRIKPWERSNSNFNNSGRLK